MNEISLSSSIILKFKVSLSVWVKTEKLQVNCRKMNKNEEQIKSRNLLISQYFCNRKFCDKLLDQIDQ